MLHNVIIRSAVLLAIALGGSAIVLHVMNAAVAAVTNPLIGALQ